MHFFVYLLLAFLLAAAPRMDLGRFATTADPPEGQGGGGGMGPVDPPEGGGGTGAIDPPDNQGGG
ncbi:MAG TPA: hypothetical protein VF432_12065 [Thermoanaerobaculia bacterium]